MPESAKLNATMDILRSQSVRAQERYIQCIFTVLSPKALIIMTDPRSKTVNARKRKTQWIFFVLKAWEPIRALRCRPFRLHLLSRGYFADSQTSSAERKLERKITRQQVIYANRRYFMISVTQLHRALFME